MPPKKAAEEKKQPLYVRQLLALFLWPANIRGPHSTTSVGSSCCSYLHLRRDGGGVEAELVALQGAKQDLELGQTILVDKLQQCKAENEQLVQQIEKLKARITNSTQDYVSVCCR